MSKKAETPKKAFKALRLSSATKDKPWLPIMVCERCGYATTSTNVCRNCPKAPPTEALNPEMVLVNLPCQYCNIQHWTASKGKRVPAQHEDSRMVYSGKVMMWAAIIDEGEKAVMKFKKGEFRPRLVANPNPKYVREYAPKNADESDKLWIGWGVVFDDR